MALVGIFFKNKPEVENLDAGSFLHHAVNKKPLWQILLFV
jgi:hypothetical protein